MATPDFPSTKNSSCLPELECNYQIIETLHMRKEDLSQSIESERQTMIQNEARLQKIINERILDKNFSEQELESIFPSNLIPKTNMMTVIDLKDYLYPDQTN